MKKVKTIVFSVAVVLASLFLCSAGCQNAADSGSSGGGGSSGDGYSGGQQDGTSGPEAELIAKIELLTDSSAPITVTLTNEVTSISDGLKTAIKNAPDGKINLNLSQTQITSIANETFFLCKSLKSVKLPTSVTSIGERAFAACDSLTDVTIPNGVRRIGFSAFNGTSLTSVTIPNGVASIDQMAFANCASLTSVTIPESVTSIGASIFAYSNSLTSVTVKATTPPTIGTNTFGNMSTTAKIFVPAGSLDSYKNANYWKGVAARIEAIQ